MVPYKSRFLTEETFCFSVPNVRRNGMIGAIRLGKAISLDIPHVVMLKAAYGCETTLKNIMVICIPG